MADSAEPDPFDLSTYLRSLSEEQVAEGSPMVMFIQSNHDQRAFVSRTLDTLQLVPAIVENRVPLFSSATQSITRMGEEARDRGYEGLADVLADLVWSLLEIHADRATHQGGWGRVFEDVAEETSSPEQHGDGLGPSRQPPPSSVALKSIHRQLFHACRLLLEVYLTGKVRSV